MRSRDRDRIIRKAVRELDVAYTTLARLDNTCISRSERLMVARVMERLQDDLRNNKEAK